MVGAPALSRGEERATHMRINAWYATLGMVALSSITVMACTTTVGNAANDSGGTSTGDDAASEASTAAPDTGMTAPDGGDAGVTCEIPDGADGCDTCALTKCCVAEGACQNETRDDAGSTQCEDIFSCVQDCLAPPADSGVDGGTLADCASACSAGHTPQGQTDFAALSTCLASSCASSCK